MCARPDGLLGRRSGGGGRRRWPGGRGRKVGKSAWCVRTPHNCLGPTQATTPPPNPLPQGEGENLASQPRPPSVGIVSPAPGAVGLGSAAAGAWREALRFSALRRTPNAKCRTGVRVGDWTRGRRPGWRGCARRSAASLRWGWVGGKGVCACSWTRCLGPPCRRRVGACCGRGLRTVVGLGGWSRRRGNGGPLPLRSDRLLALPPLAR